VLFVVAVLAGCSKPTPTEGGLRVNVTLDPGLLSKCLQVAVKASGSEIRTEPIVIGTLTQLQVGVAQHQLPKDIVVYALGFSDEQCMTETSPSERSKEIPATFVAGTVGDVALTLSPGSVTHDMHCPQGHADCTQADCDGLPCLNGGACANGACVGATTEKGLCADGMDNDGDGAIDCADDDCLGAACATADLCITGATCDASKACSGVTTKTCGAGTQPCHVGAGTCDSATGDCTYTLADAGSACDDGNPCTSGDVCSAQGACAGTGITCNNPPSTCFTTAGATCDPMRGCMYPLTASSSCNDGNTCTIDDTCLGDGGCTGTAVMCAPNACQTFGGQCLGDGGCGFGAIASGTACDAGVCNGGGFCVPSFVPAPSNFTEVQVPTPPAGVTLGCGAIAIDTSGTPSFTGWCPMQPLPGVAIITQTGGPDAVLLSFTDLTLAAGSTLHVKGARPLIIAATGNVTIAGDVDVSAGAADCGGAGAGQTGGDGDTKGGGGGGSLATTGAAGGQGSMAQNTGGGGLPGAVDSTNLALVPLRGGCPGGIGHGSPATPAAGGGALQISAAGALVVSGTLNAPGLGGAKAPAIGNGGSGGGSGGVILLEGAVITLTGLAAIAANGGGGGEGGGLIFDGAAGTAGLFDGGAAPGGSTAQGGGGGGHGATQSQAAHIGDDATIGGGGGGGGGLGRIRLRAGLSCSVGAQVILSPAANGDAGC
jgi:hypothetical protein